MDIKEILKELTETLLIKLGTEYSNITVEEGERNDYNINIESDTPSLLIGYHGENIQALQHLLKVLAWKQAENKQFNVVVDVDNYRKRQEENVIKMLERKIETVRKTGKTQVLAPMSPYFRRKIHLHCMESGYEDIETYSEGEKEKRHLTIRLKI